MSSHIDDVKSWRHFPLRLAYPFADQEGFGDQMAEIRDDPDLSSGMRRGVAVQLLEQKGLLDKFIDQCWPNGNTNDGRRLLERYRRRAQRYAEGKAEAEDNEPEDEDLGADQKFAFESDLRDYLAGNLALLEPGLTVFQQDGQRGIEYPVDDGRIDILAIDRTGKLAVIELKLSRGRNRALGQILYYMGWVEKNLMHGACRGIIVAKEISEDLRLACKRVQDISLYEYKLSVTVQKVQG